MEAQIRLENQRLTSFMSENDIADEEIGIKKPCSFITRLNHQYQPMFRNETNGIKILCQSVAS